ncbi:MAG: heme-binding domain-containing protein, partial [Silvibacterium sp.]
MKMLLRLAIACAVIVVLMQLVRPKIPAAPATAEIEAPPQVRQILDRSCYSCHSNERRLSWFDQIEP